jgi:hypothetical protein
MSKWTDVTDPENVSIDEFSAEPELDVLYGSDAFGNKYVSVPLSIVRAVIEKYDAELRAKQ